MWWPLAWVAKHKLLALGAAAGGTVATRLFAPRFYPPFLPFQPQAQLPPLNPLPGGGSTVAPTLPTPPAPSRTPLTSRVPSPPASPPPGTSSSGTYTVVRGDTLSRIAYRFTTTVRAILAVNPQITDPDLIFPRQIIYLPAGARPRSSAGA